MIRPFFTDRLPYKVYIDEELEEFGEGIGHCTVTMDQIRPIVSTGLMKWLHLGASDEPRKEKKPNKAEVGCILPVCAC